MDNIVGAKSKTNVKTLAVMAMLCAIAYVLLVVARVPVAFLTYEPKDAIITIGGFMLGPLAAAAMSIVIAFMEMITVSDSGLIGMIMNALAACSFSCTAAFIYTRKRSMKGAVIGLSAGVIAMTALMLLWNYLITPFYLGGDITEARQKVVSMMVTLLLPFNFLKAVGNMAIVMLLYKPVVTAVRKAGLLPPSKSGKDAKLDPFFILAAVVLLITCILLFLVLKGVI
ncbi:MAG: ECF transporter S component [Clostridiales bacterium]|jgi:riboflavin transporter FmnP|nr:ECF transporter S component [Clostridiales bacterium]